MGIKDKKKGPMPVFSDRWKELAKDKNRYGEAVREYQSVFPGTTAAYAGSKIREFKRQQGIA